MKIARGGMATIYLGKKVGTGEVAALKVINHEHVLERRFREMFVDEAVLLQRLSHPKIIQTFEAGIDDRGCYIAMELLLGRSLEEVYDKLLLVNGRMPLRLVAWIGREMADALHHAHELEDEQGQPLELVHRDVNPSNIFLTVDGRVLLIDFGLARARKRLSQSSEGIIKGKVPYFSPEQLAGLNVDRRVDIYSLGASLWEVIALRRLFKRDTDIDTLRAIQAGHIPDIRTVAPEVPEPLWAIIERALRTDREERYPTALAMANDLHAWLWQEEGLPAELHGELAEFLEDLYPGARAAQERWLREAYESGDHRTIFPPA